MTFYCEQYFHEEFSSKIQLKAIMQSQPDIKKQRRGAARIKMPDCIRQTEDGHSFWCTKGLQGEEYGDGQKY